MGCHLFLASPIFKKPGKPIFLRVSGKNKTKKNLDKNFLGGPHISGGLGREGHLFLARFANQNLRPPLHIDNERSLRKVYIQLEKNNVLKPLK